MYMFLYLYVYMWIYMCLYEYLCLYTSIYVWLYDIDYMSKYMRLYENISYVFNILYIYSHIITYICSYNHKYIHIQLVRTHTLCVFLCVYLQAEGLVPDRVQIGVDSVGPLLVLPDLQADVWITGTSPVLSLQPLCTHHWTHKTIYSYITMQIRQ